MSKMMFRVPLLGINTPLHEAKTGTAAQAVVDAQNSAVIFYWLGFPVIADHCDQSNMGRLMYAIPNFTQCYVGNTNYICTKKQRGIIKNGKLLDANKQPVKNVEMCVYTCTGREIQGNTEVWLTYWKKK